MSEYHYKYDPPRGGQNSRRPPNGGGPDSPLGSIIEAVFSLVMLIPMGIATLVTSLVDLFSEPTRPAGSGGVSAPGQRGGAQNSNLHRVQRSPAPSPAPSGPDRNRRRGARSVKATAGRGLIVLGSILTGIFGVSFLVNLLEEGGGLAALGAFTGLGLLTLFLGLRKRKRARRYLQYLGLIGQRESVNISTLVKATGRSRKKVCRELQDMLDGGVLPTGYLDLAGDKLVLSARGIDDKPQEPPQAAPVKEESDDNDILRQIKEVNDSIPDPVMSAKIDRIGEITGKILDYQRKNPGKASQLRSFLNYYLPTTLKILRAYAQLDKQGVEGENISAAKKRIEGMMDKVVEGFEKQLDRLFQDEALDITSDVAVLEQMLDKDGLGSDGITLEL